MQQGGGDNAAIGDENAVIDDENAVIGDDVITQSRDHRGRPNHERHHCSSDVNLAWMLLLLLIIIMMQMHAVVCSALG